jgi:hypothetical protein
MQTSFSLRSAVLALLTVACAQAQDGAYQIGYAANLPIGDSVVNISNDGAQSGFINNPLGTGNLCANVFTFDAEEEEISCCACVVTPNGLDSLSARLDLINNPLTPAVPTSISIALLSSTPGTSTSGAFTVCNAGLPPLTPKIGLLAWGTTLEPASPAGTYAPVSVRFINGNLSPSELTSLTEVCQFLEYGGGGYGVCHSCAIGALGGANQ